MGDTGGDHDLYDYCVDDPISANDFSGLRGQAVFNESDHPRDDIGRFTFKDGGGGGGVDLIEAISEVNKGKQEKSNIPKVFKPEEKPKELPEKYKLSEKTASDNHPNNRYKSELGVFENGETAFYQGGVSKIFEAHSEAPTTGARQLMGSFIPDRGWLGTVTSGADREGALRLLVYGNEKTKEASRWSIWRWSGTGKAPVGNSALEIYNWKRVTDFREVEYTNEFQDLYRQFKLFKKQ